MEQLCDIFGASPAAARLALERSQWNGDAAAGWLMSPENAHLIEAAEAAEATAASTPVKNQPRQ